jgi:hypothetical protein
MDQPFLEKDGPGPGRVAQPNPLEVHGPHGIDQGRKRIVKLGGLPIRLSGPGLEVMARFQFLQDPANNSIASPSLKLEGFGARCSRARVKLFTKHLASPKQANLNRFLCQVETTGCFSSAHVLDFPQNKNGPVRCRQAIKSLL